MAKFDKIAVLNKISSTGMVPVFYHKDVEIAKKSYKKHVMMEAFVLSNSPIVVILLTRCLVK